MKVCNRASLLWWDLEVARLEVTTDYCCYINSWADTVPCLLLDEDSASLLISSNYMTRLQGKVLRRWTAGGGQCQEPDAVKRALDLRVFVCRPLSECSHSWTSDLSAKLTLRKNHLIFLLHKFYFKVLKTHMLAEIAYNTKRWWA